MTRSMKNRDRSTASNMKTATTRRAAQVTAEMLEGRRMLSVSWNNGNLTVNGSNNPDNIIVDYKEIVPGLAAMVRVTENGAISQNWTGFIPGMSITVKGNGGGDFVDCTAVRTKVTLQGGAGDDTLRGGYGNDTIQGDGNNDTLYGNDGSDTLDGGTGDDYMVGNAGADNFIGGADVDTVSYAERTVGVFVTIDGAANDGGPFEGDNVRTDVENLEGGAGADVLYGSTFANTIHGNGSADEIHGGAGDDKLFGDAGNDNIYGDAGKDEVHGGTGQDTLVTIGGGDQDLLWGDGGFDSFWFDAHYGVEEPVDPTPSEISANHLHRIDQFHDYDINPFQQFQSIPASIHIPVSKELNGQDLVDPIAPAAASKWKNFSNHTLFSSATATFDDVKQGTIGNCWFASTMASIANDHPSRIKESVVDLGDGTYAARFYINGFETYYRVDGDLPVDGNGNLVSLKTGDEGSIWAAVLEKAFAFARNSQGSYASLDGGPQTEGFRVLGCTNVGWKGWSKFDGGFDFLKQVDMSLKQGLTLGYSTFQTVFDNAPVVGGHGYSVVRVNKDAGGNPVGLVLRNPWGVDGVNQDNNPNDALVTLTAHQAFMCLASIVWAQG